MTTSKPGVTRYMAPELLNPLQFGHMHSDPLKESDVYSFAMTAYEVFPSNFFLVSWPMRLMVIPSRQPGALRSFTLRYGAGGYYGLEHCIQQPAGLPKEPNSSPLAT